MKDLRPHVRCGSYRDELMQITLLPGEWVQVALSIGTPDEPRYEIIQLTVFKDKTCELRGNLPIRPWGSHDAVPLEEPR